MGAAAGYRRGIVQDEVAFSHHGGWRLSGVLHLIACPVDIAALGQRQCLTHHEFSQLLVLDLEWRRFDEGRSAGDVSQLDVQGLTGQPRSDLIGHY